MGRARRAEHVAQLDACGGMAVKLLRTFTAQAEALAKLRRGGEQTVRVEHVHVHPGGQAVVGNVNHREGGGHNGSSGQPHATGQPGALTCARHARCGARTRNGTPCQSPAVREKRRCRMHGGARGSGHLLASGTEITDTDNSRAKRSKSAKPWRSLPNARLKATMIARMVVGC
jgi:hypothetical protein